MSRARKVRILKESSALFMPLEGPRASSMKWRGVLLRE